MKNVTQEQKNVSQQKNNKGSDKMKKNEKMSNAIVDFIMDNDFLITFITDSVKEKIYDEKSYNEGMIEQVLVNDLDNGYSNSYILDSIIDEIDIYTLIDKIDEKYIHDFMELAEQCQQRRY